MGCFSSSPSSSITPSPTNNLPPILRNGTPKETPSATDPTQLVNSSRRSSSSSMTSSHIPATLFIDTDPLKGDESATGSGDANSHEDFIGIDESAVARGRGNRVNGGWRSNGGGGGGARVNNDVTTKSRPLPSNHTITNTTTTAIAIATATATDSGVEFPPAIPPSEFNLVNGFRTSGNIEDYFKIENELGSGQFGIVYRATTLKGGTEVAIKKLDITKTKRSLCYEEAENQKRVSDNAGEIKDIYY